MSDRYQIDIEKYHHQARTGPCFICEIVKKNPDYPAQRIYDDGQFLAFLDKYPIQYGHTLVSLYEHREQVTGDFNAKEYCKLQAVVYQVAEAVRKEVQAERIYIFTLGSNQGNAHVHWHIVPLPKGVPYEKQQFAALRRSEIGVLKITEDERISLANRICQQLKVKT